MRGGAAAALAFTAIALLTSSCTRPRYLERSVTLGEHRYRYRIWLPPNYTKLRRWPVLLFLHGSGERGDDNVRQLSLGLGPALQRYGERYKCIVVFPQCRDGYEWYGEMELQAIAALENTVREFHGDRRRLYITGISLGGSGAWTMSRHRKLFAAAVPVCGEIVRRIDDPFPVALPPDLARILQSRDPYTALAAEIGSTPVWAFHGADDDVVPVTESRSMVDALRHHRGNVRYTEYPGVRHDAWDRVYADETMVQWLLQQRLR